jgi:hypothetical protein
MKRRAALIFRRQFVARMAGSYETGLLIARMAGSYETGMLIARMAGSCVQVSSAGSERIASPFSSEPAVPFSWNIRGASPT